MQPFEMDGLYKQLSTTKQTARLPNRLRLRIVLYNALRRVRGIKALSY